jgi:hypothetical protein
VSVLVSNLDQPTLNSLLSQFRMEPVVGIEPTTDGLQNRCSTAELNWPPKSAIFLRDADAFGKRAGGLAACFR